jgi:hypothetical protein
VLSCKPSPCGEICGVFTGSEDLLSTLLEIQSLPFPEKTFAYVTHNATKY